MRPRTRLGVVISHPIQHYAPLFRHLAAVDGIHVRVFYCCDWGVRPYHDPGFNQTFAWDVDLLSGYESVFLPIDKRPEGMGFWEIDNRDIGDYLEAFQPDALWLHGYGHRTIWRAAHWARGRAALLHFGDSELLHNRDGFTKLLKSLVLRFHFSRCDAFITIGDNNEAYYRHYGVPESKMFRGSCPVDVSRFRKAAGEAENARAELRAQFGLPATAFVLLQSGKLESRKRPLDFVEAVGILVKEGRNAAGLLVGDGPLREDVEKAIEAWGLRGRVAITGFVNQALMPGLLAGGDVLVVASDFDPHPLVVTEAMSVGLPVVVSDRIGCVGPTDSARPGVNALVFETGNSRLLAACARTLIDDPSCWARMAKASIDLASSQDLPVAGAAVLRALEVVLGGHPIHAGTQNLLSMPGEARAGGA